MCRYHTAQHRALQDAKEMLEAQVPRRGTQSPKQGALRCFDALHYQRSVAFFCLAGTTLVIGGNTKGRC